MTIKPSNIFGEKKNDKNNLNDDQLTLSARLMKDRESKNVGSIKMNLDKLESSLSDYILEEKDPEDMFIEPVHIGQCPLCGGNVYSENDPSNDHTMARKCCKCTWNDNQFMTWEEMNETIEEFKDKPSKDLYVVDEFVDKFNDRGITLNGPEATKFLHDSGIKLGNTKGGNSFSLQKAFEEFAKEKLENALKVCKGVEIYLFNFGINIHDAYNEGIDSNFEYEVLGELNKCPSSVVDIVCNSTLLHTLVVWYRAEGIYNLIHYKDKINKELLGKFPSYVKNNFEYEYRNPRVVSESEEFYIKELDCKVSKSPSNKCLFTIGNYKIEFDLGIYEFMKSLDDRLHYELVSCLITYHLFDKYRFDIPSNLLEMVYAGA